jgi:hypothetical protein
MLAIITNSSYKISVPGFTYVNTIKCCAFRHYLRGEKIPGTKSTSRIKFVLRHLICGVHSMKCSVSHFWSLEIWGSSQNLANFCTWWASLHYLQYKCKMYLKQRCSVLSVLLHLLFSKILKGLRFSLESLFVLLRLGINWTLGNK